MTRLARMNMKLGHLDSDRVGACLKAAAVLAALSAGTAAMPGTAATQRGGPQNPDWPCHQILVGQISLAAVWSGPAVDGVHWRDDHVTADMVARLAARRMPLEQAEQMVGEFANSQGPNKKAKLLALFAGLFETLNDERAQVIEGLLRSGAKQRELAEKIRSESGAPQGKPPSSGKEGKDGEARELEWDLRVFDERRQAIAFVCEAPALIERRLFALAKAIQQNLD